MRAAERIKRFVYPGSYQKQWMIILLSTSLLPLLVTLVLVLDITNTYFQNQCVEALLAEVGHIQSNLENRLDEINLVNENLSNYITTRLLRGGESREQTYAELLSYEVLRDNINSIEQIYDIDRIRIFSDHIPYVSSSNHLTIFTLDALSPLIEQFPGLLGQSHSDTLDCLILESQSLPAKNIWGRARMISFYRSVYNTDRELAAVFMCEFVAEDFLSGAQAENGRALIRLRSAEGETLCQSEGAGPLSALLESAPNTGYVLKDGYLACARILDHTDWRMEIALPLTSGVGIGSTLSEVYLVIIVLSFIVSLGAALILSGRLTRRLRQYYEAVRSAGYASQGSDNRLSDKLDELVARSRAGDEIDQIMASFSTLIRDNLQLIARMKQRDLDVEKYKFQVLQEQINPHFLYNALETVRLCMAMGRREQALCTLDALSRFYRIALSRGRDTITVAEEMDMIRCYLEIENVGYDGRLKWIIQVDPLCAELPIPKFLVQPLIENSIVHGKIRKGNTCLTIDISVKTQGDTVIIRVADDGIGIEPEALERLNQALGGDAPVRGQAGFGLFNVNQRLKLFYGSDYGLCVRGDETGAENIIRLSVDML